MYKFQISFDGLFANKLQKFLCKTYVIGFLKNLTAERGSKQRLSLLQEKVVIRAVCLRTQAVSIKAWFYA